jgi:hypothetical protein
VHGIGIVSQHGAIRVSLWQTLNSLLKTPEPLSKSGLETFFQVAVIFKGQFASLA